MAFTHSPKIVTDGLTFYIDAANPRSYVSGSFNSYSLINSTISGSLINDIRFDSGSQGSFGFGFDGIDDYIQTNTRMPLTSGQTDITLNFWFKIVGISGGHGTYGYHGLIDTLAINTPRRSRILIKDDRTEIIYDVAGNALTITLTSTLSLYTWYYLTLTKDSVNGSKIYINNEYEGGDASDTGVIKGTFAGSTWPNTVFGVGAYNPTYFLNGNIANIQCYNRALTTDEIQQNYNALKNRFK